MSKASSAPRPVLKPVYITLEDGPLQGYTFELTAYAAARMKEKGEITVHRHGSRFKAHRYKMNESGTFVFVETILTDKLKD